MAGTIGTAVRRASVRQLLIIHGLALWLGALTMALILGLVGLGADRLEVPWSPPILVGAAVVLLGWTAKVLSIPGLPFPRSSWQVPSQWRYDAPLEITIGAYGYLLGLGFLTDIVTPAYYVLLGGTVAAGSLVLAIVGWTLYALVRFLPTFWYAYRVARGAEDARPPHRNLLIYATAVWLAVCATLLIANVV